MKGVEGREAAINEFWNIFSQCTLQIRNCFLLSLENGGEGWARHLTFGMFLTVSINTVIQSLPVINNLCQRRQPSVRVAAAGRSGLLEMYASPFLLMR